MEQKIKKIIKPIYIRLRDISYRILVLIYRIKIQEFDDKILNNKKVIIIGPAETALSYMKSKDIDKFDFVVRVNKSHLNLKQYTDRLGTRTDILFHCCYPDPIVGCEYPNEDALIEQKNKYVIYPYDLPHAEINFWRCLLKFRRINFFKLDKKYFNDIVKIYKGKHPTTGFQALSYLLHQDLKELHITGLTFLKTPYIDGYRDTHKTPEKINEVVKKSGNHNPDAELELFCQLIENRKNVFMDATLNQIVDEAKDKC